MSYKKNRLGFNSGLQFRPLQQIDQEYSNLAVQVGDKGFLVDKFCQEIDAIYKRMEELRQEHLKAAEFWAKQEKKAEDKELTSEMIEIDPGNQVKPAESSAS